MENTQSTGQQRPPREYPVIDACAMKLKETLRAFEPSPQVSEHFRNARVEFLKGIRQIIDDRIQRVNRQSQHGTNVTVE